MKYILWPNSMLYTDDLQIIHVNFKKVEKMSTDLKYSLLSRLQTLPLLTSFWIQIPGSASLILFFSVQFHSF